MSSYFDFIVRIKMFSIKQLALISGITFVINKIKKYSLQNPFEIIKTISQREKTPLGKNWKFS